MLRHAARSRPIHEDPIVDLARAVSDKGLAIDVLKPLVPLKLDAPACDLEELLDRIDYRRRNEAEVLQAIGPLCRAVKETPCAATDARDWIMGQLRPIALGNVPLRTLASAVEEALQ